MPFELAVLILLKLDNWFITLCKCTACTARAACAFRLQQLEKELYFYKKTSRDLKKKIREMFTVGKIPAHGKRASTPCMFVLCVLMFCLSMFLCVLLLGAFLKGGSSQFWGMCQSGVVCNSNRKTVL